MTDESGNVTERYAYDAYGVPTIFDAAGVERRDQYREESVHVYRARVGRRLKSLLLS